MVFSQLVDFLFPRVCLDCQTPWSYMCQACRKKLVPHPDRCPFCHRTMLYGQTCYDCLPDHRWLAGVMVAFVYTDTIKKLILQLKFFHKYDCASYLGERVALLIQSNPYLEKARRDWTLLVSFVPSHRRRRWMIKGYNQSELLARQVAKQLAIPLLKRSKKVKRTRSQVSLSRQQRLRNLVGAFVTTPWEEYPPESNKTLLIVDDITTTGATLEELAKTRKTSYPHWQIRGVVIGRHGR